MTEQRQDPSVYVDAEFIRDLTVENKNPFDLLSAEEDKVTPRMLVDVDTHFLGDDKHHVTLKTKLEFLIEDAVKYLLEIEYVGRCVVKNASDEILPLILNVQCSNIIFPAVRHIIAFSTQNSGLPPFNLQGIDFMDLFQRKQMLTVQG